MKNGVTVIDFGTSKIVTVVTEERTDEQLGFLGVGVVDYDGFNSEGEWNTPRRMVQKLHASITAAERESGMTIREVYVGVPGAFINVRTQTVEIEAEGRRAEELREPLMDKAADMLGVRETRQLVLHRMPAYFRVDGGEKTFDPKGECEKLEGQISFILAIESFLADVSEMLGVLGITILGFASSTYGADMLLLQTEERDEGAVVVDCGFANTDVTVVQGDSVSYHAVLPFGGMDIMRELVEQLEVGIRDAERIKRDCGFKDDEYEQDSDFKIYDDRSHEIRFIVKRSDANDVIRRTTREGLAMLRDVLNEDAQPYLGESPRVHLVGGGISRMRGAAEFVALEIGRETVIGTPFASRLNSPEFVSVLGLIDVVTDATGGYAPEPEVEAPAEEPKKRTLFGKK